MLGIVNGTTNYILTQMSEHGWSFDEALAEAQSLGYAEADPTADVEGFDAAAKCAILASIAFNSRVVADDVYREGITAITAQDIADAARMGYVVKLLAIAELDDGEISARVHPAMIPASHPLARGARRVQRGVHRRPEGGPADVLRARAPVATPPRPPSWATWSRPRATWSRAAARSGARARSTAASGPWTTRAASTT